ncbi:MAG: 16S rRNA (cytosine(1402)-N(4))-methyltransferase RsmH [Bacillota bacterium]|nr:16S rRNA (cytosine(1402)-N(4))-methyltransferase RsmH [Bacillota bacterium]
MSFVHIPVLLEQAVALLAVKKNGIYVDCTLGGGGHSNYILNKLEGTGQLYSFDQDIRAISNAKEKFAAVKNITIVHSNFENLVSKLAELNVAEIDGVLYDLGVSSPQLDEGERGFSYQQDAQLDMRMDKNIKITAQQVVNGLEESELSHIFWQYGEERWAKRVAQFIVAERKNKQIITTGELVTIIKKAIPKAARKEGPHPAKRVFQALRIYVNRELEVLEKSLEQAISLLKPGGRLSVITFHSLEDRIVKQFIKEKATGCKCPPHLPMCVCGQEPVVKNLTKKAIEATAEEIEVNPRARSAKLRGCEKY